MKLYDGGRVPNARRVRVFLAEKGITVSLQPVDMAGREHCGEAFARLNPLRKLPVLELDDGTIITESMAICRYFDALHPLPTLFGAGAKGVALVEMWNRRLELELYQAVQHAFRHTHPAMADLEVPQVPAWGEANRPKAMAFLMVLDRHLATTEFVCGSSLSVADITGLVTLDFFKPARLTLPEELHHVRRWHEMLSKRASAVA